MTAFSEPTKWAQALGATANADVIPDEAGATEVDISKIFPAVFSVPLSQGGKAIPRRTLNGIFKTLGEWAFFNQNGGVPSYNADFDYTVGRLVSYNGSLYKCIQDNVHAAPHNPTDTDYWVELSDSSDIDNIVTELNNKADRSLSNVDNTANILMAHNAMPSHTYDTLTLGASGTSYTAPADGYFSVHLDLKQSGYFHMIINNPTTNTSILYSLLKGTVVGNYGTFLPVQKGDLLQVNYDGVAVLYAFCFVYAVGAASENVSGDKK